MTQIQHHVMMPHGLYNEQGFIPVLLAVIHGSLHMLHSQLHVFWFHLCKSRGMGCSVTLWQRRPHDISPNVFLSKWLHLNECVLRQTWPSLALQILAWKLASAASHVIYPSGIGGQEEEGRFAPLRSLSLCRFYTQTHWGGLCVSVEWAFCEQMPDLERVGLDWAWLC